jgi:hypothetical protein
MNCGRQNNLSYSTLAGEAAGLTEPGDDGSVVGMTTESLSL